MIFVLLQEFVNNTKQELLDRSVAVEKYTGAKLYKFLHNANIDGKQQALHNKFLNFKTNENDFHKYIVPSCRTRKEQGSSCNC